LFHGRVQDGSVVIGDNEPAGEEAPKKAAPGVAFVRPHDIRVTRDPAGTSRLAAKVVRSNAAGPVANLELVRVDSGESFTVQLSKEEFQQLQPKAGEQVYVQLLNVKVFSDDYSI